MRYRLKQRIETGRIDINNGPFGFPCYLPFTVGVEFQHNMGFVYRAVKPVTVVDVGLNQFLPSIQMRQLPRLCATLRLNGSNSLIIVSTFPK